MARTRWKCKNCGHEHRTNPEQCVHCGYVDLEAVQGDFGQLNRTLTAALPILLIALFMALMAVILFL